jgi:hypothetical protein
MGNRCINEFFLFLCLISVLSCHSKFGVLEYYPLQEYEYSSEEQDLSFALEDFANLLIVNYWEGALEIQSAQPESVSHANRGPDIHNDLSVDGGWFTAQATHEPTQLKVKIDKNESNSPRHIEMYVDIVNRDASGKVTQKAGSGYHIFMHQAAAGTKIE